MVERVGQGATLRRSLTQATHAVLPAMLFPCVPGAHATQSVADVDFSMAEALPLSHEVHVDWPAESANEPAVQSEHEVAPFAPPVEVPMSQAMHADSVAPPAVSRRLPAAAEGGGRVSRWRKC